MGGVLQQNKKTRYFQKFEKKKKPLQHCFKFEKFY